MTIITDPTGVQGYIRIREVCMETRESLTLPHEAGFCNGLTLPKQSEPFRLVYPPEEVLRKEMYRKWYPYREKSKGRRRAKAVLASP